MSPASGPLVPDEAGRDSGLGSLRSAWWHIKRLPGSALFYTRWNDLWGRPREGYAYVRAPWYVAVIYAICGAPLFTMIQVYGPFVVLHGWPTAPLDLMHAAATRIEDWCEARATWYTWLPPDSGDPDEIGLHYRSDLLTAGVERPRIYRRFANAR